MFSGGSGSRSGLRMWFLGFPVDLALDPALRILFPGFPVVLALDPDPGSSFQVFCWNPLWIRSMDLAPGFSSRPSSRSGPPDPFYGFSGRPCSGSGSPDPFSGFSSGPCSSSCLWIQFQGFLVYPAPVPAPTSSFRVFQQAWLWPLDAAFGFSGRPSSGPGSGPWIWFPVFRWTRLWLWPLDPVSGFSSRSGSGSGSWLLFLGFWRTQLQPPVPISGFSSGPSSRFGPLPPV